MTTVQDIYRAVDSLAPFSLGMDFDNPGLLVGDPSAPVSRVLLALDCTCRTVSQAQNLEAQLILTHHPVIFHPIKRVTAGSPVFQAASSGIAVISAHTNLDIASGGVNDCLAQRIGLTQVQGLEPVSRTPYRKVAAFVPTSHAEAVRDAMTQAGAGQLGDYSACTFSTPGQGTFQPEEGAHPFLGQVGQLERADEVRLEMICPPECLDRVVAAMREAHPYELPAYDVFVDEAVAHTEYLGRIGQLEAPLSPRDFAQRVKERIGAVSVKYLDADRPIQTVALCSGSGADLMGAALAAGADALLTADVKHNQFIDAQEAGITLLDAGHFDTEDLVLEPLAQRLEALLPVVSFLVTHYSNIRAV